MASNKTSQAFQKGPQNKSNEPKEENLIKLRGNGSASSYIRYAAHLLLRKENSYDRVVLKAAGAAIHTCCLVADILRTRIEGLAQVSEITHIESQDVYQPRYEGMTPVLDVRKFSVLVITLVKQERLTEADRKQPGFQLPKETNTPFTGEKI